MGINGIINVNKPEGRTSFSIVAWLRRLIGEKRVGHAGTLDPMATGVLPLCFGQGTRIIQFLIDSNKEYLAHIELGAATDTFDREGKVTQRGDPGRVTLTQIEETIEPFRGIIEQVPPLYSALKYQGRRYSDLARAGMPVQPKPRQVQINHLELIDWKKPVMVLRIECSKGTYVRSLAHDIGQSLGCGAYLKNLVRLRCGRFHIEDSLSLNQIESAFLQGSWEEISYPVDSVLLNWKEVIVGKEDETAIRNGRSLSLDGEYEASGEYCRAYGPDGHFVAVLHFVSEKKLWCPAKVFSL